MEKKYVAATIEKQLGNDILDDLALLILSKLPLKSLKRFGCVRKSWALLFENHHFINIFRNNFISNYHHSHYDDDDTSLFLWLKQWPSIVPEINFVPEVIASTLSSLSGERFQHMAKLDWPNPFQEDKPDFYILSPISINGILYLYTKVHDGESTNNIVLWNPTNHYLKVIPSSPFESVPPDFEVDACYDGFGYDSVKDDYKVIRQLYCYEIDYYSELELECPWAPFPNLLWEIYSLRSNSWRKLDVVPGFCSGFCGQEAFYLDGMCHWLDNYNVVLSFDFSNEVFFTTLCPVDIPLDMYDNFDLNLVQKNLVSFNGSIALISNYKNTTIFYISILGEVGVKESWIRLFVVEPLACVEDFVGVGKKGDIFFRKKDNEIAWFDLSTHMIKELGVKAESYCCHIIIYRKSFFQLGEE